MINILKIARSGMRYCSDKSYRVIINTAFGLYNNLPDEEFLKKYYRAVFHRELNLNDPKTFNEKLQWLKLYNRKPELVSSILSLCWVYGMILRILILMPCQNSLC